MFVDSILRTKGSAVHTLSEAATLADAVAALNSHNIGALVITAATGAVTGILSERDIVRRLGTDPATTLAQPVTACMTPDPVTCTSTTSVEEIMERMTRRRIRHVPVVDEGALVGIVSIGDVVKSKIEQVETEAEAMRDYIAG